METPCRGAACRSPSRPWARCDGSRRKAPIRGRASGRARTTPMHAARSAASSARRRRGKDYSAVWETFYKQIGSEDCLYPLNVWSPTGATDASKLPVIVYIHGGSNVVGAAFDPLLLGGNLAKNANAVVVTVAYRLGVFWLVRQSGVQHRRSHPRFRQFRLAGSHPVAEVRHRTTSPTSAATRAT